MLLLPADKAPQNHTDRARGPLGLVLPLEPVPPAEWPVKDPQRAREQRLGARSEQEGAAAAETGRSGAARSDTGCAGVWAEADPGTGTSATGTPVPWKQPKGRGNGTAAGHGRKFRKESACYFYSTLIFSKCLLGKLDI